MLLAEDQGRTLLYTGDFKLRPSLTAEPAELPHADTLVIESTYGHPDYRLPPREESIAEFLALVRRALADEMRARHSGLRAGQEPGNHPPADGRRHSRAAAPQHLRGQPDVRIAGLSAGPVRAFPRACGTGLGRHRSARHVACRACRGRFVSP